MLPGGREDLWELGGDRDIGLGSGCIFNAKESGLGSETESERLHY